jgi:hypothetical protein
MAKTWRSEPTRGSKFSDRKKAFASEQPTKTSAQSKQISRAAMRPDKYSGDKWLKS